MVLLACEGGILDVDKTIGLTGDVVASIAAGLCPRGVMTEVFLCGGVRSRPGLSSEE
jgi:hypothetical protein